MSSICGINTHHYYDLDWQDIFTVKTGSQLLSEMILETTSLWLMSLSCEGS